MRKSILLSLMLIASCLCTAQSTLKIGSDGSGFLKSTAVHATTDTITNTTPRYQYVNIDGYQDIVTIQPTVTKISGTVGGTLKVQGSVDNVAYTDIASQSFTATDVASQTTTFVLTPSNFRWYRLSYVGSGTQSAKIKSPVIVRKRS